MNPWLNLWSLSPAQFKDDRPEGLDRRPRSGLLLAITLVVARFYSQKFPSLWDKCLRAIKGHIEISDALNEIEGCLRSECGLDIRRLRPQSREIWDESGSIVDSVKDSIQSFISGIPMEAFSGDFLGLIYQAWETEGAKTSRGAYFTSASLARTLIQGLIFEKKLDEDEPLRICDPACGSGMFFLELMHALKSLYLALNLRKKVVLQGFDVDPIAVWIARLNLVLQEILPPPLAQEAIQLKDALKDGSSHGQVYDIILGNPPFYEVHAKEYADLINGSCSLSRINIASLFIVKFAPMLRAGGQLGLIFPRAFLFSGRWTFLREFLQRGEFFVPRLLLFNRGFAHVGIEQIGLFLRRGGPPPALDVVELEDGKEGRPGNAWQIPAPVTLAAPQFLFPLFATQDMQNMLAKIHQNSVPLETICEKFPNSFEPAIFRGLGWEKYLSGEKTGSALPAIKGTDIFPFGVKQYRYISRLPPPTDPEHLPQKLSIINSHPVVACQRLVSSKTRVVATNLPPHVIPISTLTCICLPQGAECMGRFIVGILNSTFASYFVADHIFFHSRLSTSLDKEYLRYFPIPKRSVFDSTLGTNLADLVSTIEMDLKNKFIAQPGPEQMLQINTLAFQCYGLNDEESLKLSQTLHSFWQKRRESS